MLTPDLKKTEEFVDAEIRHDSLVRPSIEDGYMTRDELVIARWVRTFCYDNAEASHQSELWEQYLPEAFRAASEHFSIPSARAEELWELSKNLRARNLPGYEEMMKELKELESQDPPS